MDLMKIYNSSPIFFQNIMTTVQGLVFKRERFGDVYRKALGEYMSRDYSDRKALEDYQWERAGELIRYAVANSPFYQEFYKGIDIEQVIAKRDLSMLPVLEKEIVRSNISRMYTMLIAEGLVSNTSGTTGKSMRFLYRKDDPQRRMAYLDAFKMRRGYVPFKMKRASLNSAKIVVPGQKQKIFWRDNLAINQRIYSGYHCQGDNVKYYIENMNKYKPDSLDGYPSAMYELAKYILQNNIQLTFTPKGIFPTSEALLPHYKEAIEKAFGCRVYDQYASSEGAPFITECENGKLHYCMDTGIIEFLDDGRMLMTCFETHGTPLIRYDIGDSAYLSDNQKCSCGCAMPIVDHIEGRSLDYIQTPTHGRFTSIYMSLVSGEFNNCMKGMQFVQNDLYSLDVYLAVDENYDPKMNEIIVYKLRYDFGDEMEIRIHIVDEMQKEPSGKVRLIINKVAKKK